MRRPILLIAVVSMLSVLTFPAGGRPADDSPWFTRALVGMEVGPTGAQFGSDPTDVGYAARFDGREIVRACKRSGCEYLVIWARDGEYAYYDSKLQPEAPGLKGRDVVREAVEEGRQQRIPVLAYCVLQTPTQALRAHPEWRMVDSAGKPINGRVCFNSPCREYIKGLLKEMLDRGIAGFHLDMVDQGFGAPYGCWCDNCRPLFEKKYSRAMPKGVTWDADWDRMLDFRYDSSDRFEKDLTAYIRSVNPRASIDFNYHGNPPFSWEVGQRPVQHASNGDFVTGETGTWGFSALTVGLNAAFYRAATPGKRFQVAMQRGVRMYHDQTTRPLVDIRWELLTLLAHNSFVTMVDKTAYTGQLDPLAYDRIGEAFKDAKTRRAHFGQPVVADVGLWFSTRTRDWYGRDKPFNYFASFLGAHKAMVYDHIPWDVVLDENATLGRLKRHAVICVPNAACLTARETDLIERYVRGGGHLILTGLTGCFDEMGVPRAGSSVEALTGAQFVQRLDSLDNHVRSERGSNAAALWKGIRPDWSFLVKGPAVVLKQTTATAYGELMAPDRTVRQKQGIEGTDWPMSAGEAVGPAVLVNRVGRGTVVTFACSPDFAAASEHHVAEARRLLVNAVRLLHPHPHVTISAPANVEAVVTEDPATRTLRIHLIGYNAPAQTMPGPGRPFVIPALMEQPAMYRATITCAVNVKSAAKLDASTALRRNGNRIDVTVEDVHEAIVIRY